MSQSDFVTRGQALVGAGQFQEAVKVCRLGLLGRPTTVEGRVVLGQALLALKRYDEVLAEMRVALELDHASISAQALKGEALLRKGDPHAAIDVLQLARALAPSDPQVGALLADAERATGRRVSANRPAANGHAGPGPAAAGFGDPHADDGSFLSEAHTKNYPHHGAEDEPTGDEGVEDTGGSFTRPTSLSSPGLKPSSPLLSRDGTPPPSVLAVGDRSGTVEVDPEMDGVELGDDDLGDVVAPPHTAARSPGALRAEGRGQVIPSSGAPMAKQPSDRSDGARERKAARNKGEISSVELMDDEIMDLDDSVPPVEGPRKLPGPSTAVRNVVNQPAGPMADRAPLPRPTAASGRPTAHVPAQLPPPAGPANVPPHLAQLIANQPHVMQVAPVPQPQPMPMPMPMPVNPRSAIAAAMPTQAAMPVPQLFPSNAAAARATMLAPPSGAAQQQQAAAAVDQLFADEAASSAMGSGGRNAPRPVATPWSGGPGGGSPGGAPMPGRIGPEEMTRRPMPIDPQLASMFEASGASGTPAPSSDPMSAMSSSSVTGAPSKASKTGMRKGRSRMQVMLWVLVGAVMIGGGVFAGFQIRAMRLGKQITAARGEAVALATTDTWQGWVGARNRLASIAQASSTLDNRAALARARAIVAYEFGDGLAEAQASVTELSGQGGLDAEIAAAFLALAQHDATAARSAADRALALAATDAAALYASSQASLLAGDLAGAITAGKAALEQEARAMYAVGLARAYAAASAWDDGLAALDQALKVTPEHPGALIARSALLAESGRIAGNPAANDVRTALEKVVREGTKPVAEQARGVSPMQVAFADLALARLDAARGNLDAAKQDLSNALAVGLDDQRFAEEVVETLYSINLLAQGRVAVERALTAWPASRRARTALAQIALAEGRPAEALDVLSKGKDASLGPNALAVRGAARLAAGDLDGARGDLDTALKRAPQLELAIAGRVAIDLRMNELEEAKARVTKAWRPGAASPAMAIAYASVMRVAGDAAAREQAKAALERAISGAGVETARAQLEYARLQRELGDMGLARAAFGEAARAGSYDARLELGLLLIEDREPIAGQAAIDALVKESGAQVPPALLLEAARARMLAGDHAAAAQALDELERMPDVVRWQLDRERGRLAFRRGDPAGAALALMRALDGCGEDAETFLLAADVAGADLKQAKLVEKVQSLTKARLKTRPEASIIAGKLALAEDANDAAEAAYKLALAELEKQKATPRRQAQAEFGRAVVAYYKVDNVAAQNALELTIALDPSIYAAYLFLADLLREKAPDRAFEFAQTAVKFNPDFVDGWVVHGTLAHQLRKRAEVARSITRVNALAPGSEELRQLQSLR